MAAASDLAYRRAQRGPLRAHKLFYYGTDSSQNLFTGGGASMYGEYTVYCMMY